METTEAIAKIRFWQENYAADAARYETDQEMYAHYGSPAHRNSEGKARLLADVLALFEVQS